MSPAQFQKISGRADSRQEMLSWDKTQPYWLWYPVQERSRSRGQHETQGFCLPASI